MSDLIEALSLLGSVLNELADPPPSASFTLPNKPQKVPTQKALPKFLSNEKREPIKPILGVFNKGFLVTPEGLKLKVLMWDLEHRQPKQGQKISGVPTKRLDAIQPGTLITHD